VCSAVNRVYVVVVYRVCVCGTLAALWPLPHAVVPRPAAVTPLPLHVLLAAALPGHQAGAQVRGPVTGAPAQGAPGLAVTGCGDTQDPAGYDIHRPPVRDFHGQDI